MTKRYTKMTCKIGAFYFFNAVNEDRVEGKGKGAKLIHGLREQPLSQMKTVRDAVMAKVLDPRIDRAKPIRTTEQLYKYAGKHINGPASKTRFLFIPAAGVWIKQGEAQQMGRQHRSVQRAA